MKIKWSQRLRYFFDTSMSKGTISLIIWISIFSAILVLTVSSIIVLPPPNTKDPDLYAIKTVLALINNPNRRAEPYHIATVVRSRKSLEIIKMIGNGEVQALFVGDLVARILAQTARQPGLSLIFEELLSFNGNEIYFEEQTEFIGKRFTEALLAFDDSALIGICSGDGRIQINPAKDIRIKAGDKLVFISLDDGDLNSESQKQLTLMESAIHRNGLKHSPQPEKILVLGWNRFAKILINELRSYVAPGSRITVAADELGE